MKISNMMLKNGFYYLINENEDQFKKSLIDVLSFKLNESIDYLHFQFKKSLLKDNKVQITDDTKEMKDFISFIESYDPMVSSKIKLKNDSVINITESDMEAIKGLFDSLNPKNRQQMVEQIFQDKVSLEQHIDFYKKVKVLNK